MNVSSMRTYFFIIQFLIFVGLGNVTAQAAGIDARVPQELSATGHAKVILALNLPEPNRLRMARAALIRDPIGNAQEAVLSSLPAGSYELAYQYSHVPGLAMTVTPESFAILKDHPQVKYIQFDELEHIALAEAAPWIKANLVWANYGTGAGVTVAVLDTGINTVHEDFTGRIEVQQCFLSTPSTCPSSPNVAEDGNGHGSHVSGIIAAAGTTRYGVAPGAKIAAIKVCSDTGGCQVSDSLAGLNWVVANYSSHGIKVVNMSIASSTLYSGSCDKEDNLRKTVVDSLINEGVIVFAAAGNDGGLTNGKSTMAAPACLSNTVAVGATYDKTYSPSPTTLVCSKVVTNQDTATCFSNSSVWLDILAPGSEITSSWKGTSTVSNTEAGTSMATPMASGVAALMLQKKPALTPAQIKAKLKKTGVNVTDTNGITRPRIDALAAVEDAGTLQPIIEMISDSGSYLINQEKLDFGWTTTGESVTKTITVKNAGTAPLNLTFSSISSGFSVTPPTFPTLNVGGQQSLQIQLEATTVGSYTGTLQFTTDDPISTSVQLNLVGTVCDLRTTPFSENFEVGAIPDCWRVISNDTSNRDWGIYGSTDISVIGGNKSVAVMSLTSPMSSDDDWLVLPKITLSTSNNNQLQFKARDEADPESFNVKLSTTGNNISDFITLIATETTGETAPTTAFNYSYPLNNYAGQNVYLAIQSTSAAFNNSTLVIDDVSVTDISPPNYQNTTPTTSNLTATGFDLTVRLDEMGEVYYAVLPVAATAPDATQIKNGTGATVNGSISVTAANSDFSETISGLSSNTTYKVYVVSEDTSLNQTTVTPISVTTATPDTTPPSFNSTPAISAITSSGFTFTVNSNETGKAYYVVLPSASSAPSDATDIKTEQTSGIISGVVTKGTLNVTANTTLSQVISGLAANTGYKIYLVLEDAALNLSNVTMRNATTSAIATPTTSTSPGYAIIERKDGTGTGRISSYSTGQPVWAPTIVMTATPNADSVFVKWTGNIHSQDCYGDQPTVYVRLNAIKTCTATFDKITADNQALVPVKLAAYYLPGIENSGKAWIRITNTNPTSVTVKGTLYHASGQLLGIANSVLIPTLAPQATVELSTTDLAKLSSAPAWTGLAWLHITTPNGLKMLNLLENDNKILSNFSTLAQDNVLYNLPASTSTEQANVVLINTGDTMQTVTATLYADTGQILGKTDAILADVAARGIVIISMRQLESLVGTTAWTGHVAKLRVTAATNIKLMTTLLSGDATITNLTPTHDNAVFNLPGATNLDQAFVYISNTTDTAMSVQATLYHQDGYMLGNPNTVIINQLAPQATQLLSVSDVEKLFKVPTWQKRARLMITAPTAGIKVMVLIHNDSGVSNLSAMTSEQVPYLPDVLDADKAYIRIANTHDIPVTVTGIVYAETGQILGSGVIAPALAAQTITVISVPVLQEMLKIPGWQGKARLVLNPSGLQVMNTLRSNAGQLLDMSDIAQ